MDKLRQHIFLLFAIAITLLSTPQIVSASPSNNGHSHTFSVSSLSICIGDTLTVQDTCVHDAFKPTSRVWSFSQGASQGIINNQSQAKVCFTTPGVKVITLSVYDIFNVAYTDAIQIIVRGSIANAGFLILQ